MVFPLSRGDGEIAAIEILYLSATGIAPVLSPWQIHWFSESSRDGTFFQLSDETPGVVGVVAGITDALAVWRMNECLTVCAVRNPDELAAFDWPDDTMHLDVYATSKFSWAELRAAQSYLEVHDGRVRVSLGWWATFLFWFSLSAVIIMGVYVAVSITPLLRIHSLGTYAAIALLIGIYVCFAWFIGRDARDVAVARRVKAKIEALPAPMLGAEAEAPTPAA